MKKSSVSLKIFLFDKRNYCGNRCLKINTICVDVQTSFMLKYKYKNLWEEKNEYTRKGYAQV